MNLFIEMCPGGEETPDPVKKNPLKKKGWKKKK